MSGKFSVEYTIGSGEPREVYVDGVCIYRTQAEADRTKAPNNVAVEVDGWKQLFAERYVDLGLNAGSSNEGYRSPTFWLAKEGLIPPLMEA